MVTNWRPVVAQQGTPFECGFVCVSAVLAMYGRQVPSSQLRARGAESARGTSISQLKHLLEEYGASVKVVAFDDCANSAIPSPSILLLNKGHFVVTGKRRRKKIDVFFPEHGWRSYHPDRLRKDFQGIALHVVGLDDVLSSHPPIKQSELILAKFALKQMCGKLGRKVLTLFVLAQLIVLGLPLFAKQSIDMLPLAGVNTAVSVAAVAFLSLSVIGTISQGVASWGNQVLSTRMNLSASSWFIDRIAALEYSYLEKLAPTQLQNLLGAIYNIQKVFSDWPGQVIRIALGLTVGICVVLLVSPWLVIAGLVATGISMAIDVAFQSRSMESSSAIFNSEALARANFLQTVSNISAFKRAGALPRAKATFRSYGRRLSIAQQRGSSNTLVKNAINSTAANLDNLMFACVAGYFVTYDSVSLGTFVALGLYKDQFAGAIRATFSMFRQYQLSLPQRLLIRNFLAEEAKVAPEQSASIRGGICVRNVSFSYSKNESSVIKNLSLEIDPGQTIVFRGPSGCGKSTLARLVCGIASPSEGEVLIDGNPVQAHFAGLSAVMQTDTIMTTSVRENVRMFRRGVGDEDVYRALDLAELGDFVRALPMGLATPIGQDVAGLSGGQKQRILIARSLVVPPKLLILDEATSSLDLETEANILANIRRTGITLLICTHRPEVWAEVDSIYDFESQRLMHNSSAKVRAQRAA